jgi:hypothetical protein
MFYESDTRVFRTERNDGVFALGRGRLATTATELIYRFLDEAGTVIGVDGSPHLVNSD